MDGRQYRPSFRGLMKPYEAVLVLGVVLAAVYGIGSSAWVDLAMMALVFGGLATWHFLGNGTAVDGEGFTSTRFTRSVSLSWPEVQEVRTEPGVRVVVVYDQDGERLLLHDVPAKDVEVIRELWAAGTGEDWVRTPQIPELAPAPISATTGLGSAVAFAAGTGFLGLVVVSLLDDQGGLFEVAALARQDLVVVLLCLVIAPVVAFAARLTLVRRSAATGHQPSAGPSNP